MKNKHVILVVFFLCIIFLYQFKLIYRPIIDKDEGIYTISLLLINNGNPAYRQTFLSQPPGFILAVYSGFKLFGQNLQAARFTIGLWSLIGALAVLWIGCELKNTWQTILAMSLSYLIPTFYIQTNVLQSDILVVTFSLLSLAAMVKFINSKKIFWFVITSFFLNFAFWTKFDISLIPSMIFMIILFYYKKEISPSKLFSMIMIFSITSIIFFLLFIFPFGISDVFRNTVGLRLKALTFYPLTHDLFLSYLKKDLILLLIVMVGILLSIINRARLKYPAIIFLIWELTTIFFLIIYQPLFPHHLSLLVMPATLFFSYQFGYVLQNKRYAFKVISVIVLIISISYRIYIVIKTPSEILTGQQKSAVSIIKEYTNLHDYVISDEAILNAESGRLPPPALADISFVRIQSKDISTDRFIQIVNKYKPKLIIAWNGRLQSINNFKSSIVDYRLLSSLACGKNIYIRNNNHAYFFSEYSVKLPLNK